MINLSGSTGLTKIIANSAYIGTKGTYNSLTSSSNGLIDFPTNGISIYRDNGTTLDPWGPIFPLTAPSTTVAIATTTLNQSGVNGATTSITVASSSGLPATPFLAMFGTFVFTSEAFKVTNVSGTTWTIVRSANGLSASSPANGSTITVANWALVDASNISTITTTNGGLYFSVNQGASGVNNLVGLVKIAPTTPYNVVVGFLPNYSTASTYF
jgi:hypothetical protein